MLTPRWADVARHVGARHRRNSRMRPDLALTPAPRGLARCEPAAAARRCRRAGLRCRDTADPKNWICQRQHALRCEAGRIRGGRPEAAHHQPRPDQQHDAHRELCGDQRLRPRRAPIDADAVLPLSFIVSYTFVSTARSRARRRIRSRSRVDVAAANASTRASIVVLGEGAGRRAAPAAPLAAMPVGPSVRRRRRRCCEPAGSRRRTGAPSGRVRRRPRSESPPRAAAPSRARAQVSPRWRTRSAARGRRRRAE